MISTQFPSSITRRHMAGKKADDSLRDMKNYKPFRTAAQKKLARADAKLVDGRYVSKVSRSYHQ